ncbi:MAG: SDR family oxidoreductase [Verrucomicrobiota bacterium]
MKYDPHGKTVLITGANRGIGKAIVETFIKHGVAKVYATARKPESIAPLVEAHGEKVVPLELDLSKPETITAAAAAASDVEIVVNNGGVLTQVGPLDDKAIESFAYELEVNVYGLMRVAQAFAPVLKANGGGALVQLNSVASYKSFTQVSTYSASKAASYSITQALYWELKEQGTRVVSVHPGPILSDMADSAGLTEIAEPPELVAEGIIQALEAGDFYVFPDTMAKQFGAAYASFAQGVVLADMSES